MNYALHYQRLMERAENRVLDGYSERHHVVPRCLDKTSRHTVRLTPEEHYVAHQLLVKMYPGNYKLVFAAVKMTHATRTVLRSNKMYGWLRRAWNDSASDAARAGWIKFRASVTPEEITRLRRAAALATMTLEKRAKHSAVSVAAWKRIKSDPVADAAVRANQSAAQKKSFENPERRTKHLAAVSSPEVSAQHKEANKNRVWTEASRANSSRARVSFYKTHPENKALNSTPDARAKNSAGGRAAWCKKKIAESFLSPTQKSELHEGRSLRAKNSWITRRRIAENYCLIKKEAI